MFQWRFNDRKYFLGRDQCVWFSLSLPSDLNLPKELAEYNEEDASTFIDFVLTFSPTAVSEDGNGDLVFSTGTLLLSSMTPRSR